MAAGSVTVQVSTPNAYDCASFDGVDDYVILTSFAGLSSFTLSFDVLVRSQTDDSTLPFFCNVSGAGQNRFNFGYNSDFSNNRVRVTLQYRDAVSATQSKTFGYINSDVWVNLILTYDGEYFKIYINGVYDSVTNGNSTNIFWDNTSYCLGQDNWNPSPKNHKGSQKNVRVWNRVLITDEISKVAAGDSVTNGLIHRWKLYDDYNDSVGTAHGTNSGSVLQTVDDQVANDLKDLRVTANDKWIVNDIGGQVMINHIEEAA